MIMTQQLISMFSLPEQNYLEILLRLIFAVIMGGLIGLERSGRHHDAGLRTHILVCLGAAGIAILSQLTHQKYGGDVARFGAQVVSGIGFLGAGCIMVKGGHISGLTTAAGLWSVGCLGLVVGMGYFYIAVTMVILMLISMLVLHPLSDRIRQRGSTVSVKLRIWLRDRSAFQQITKHISKHEVLIHSAVMEDDNVCLLHLHAEDTHSANAITLALMELENVMEVRQV